MTELFSDSPRRVNSCRYFRSSYDSKARWASYWHQAAEVMECVPSSCLEIGKGNGTVLGYLRSRGLKVVSADIDPRLSPDVLGDVRLLPFADGQFAVVLYAEVLERIKFAEVSVALSELRRACRRRVVVSIPHVGRYFELAVRISPLCRLAVVGKLPDRHDTSFDGQHYWELGARNYPPRKVREQIERFFTVVRDYLVPENPYHHFYILDKR